MKLFTIDNVPLANRKRYSQASIWKMAIKYSLVKLTFDSPFREFIESQIQINDWQILPLNLLYFERVAQLPVQYCSRYVEGKFGYITRYSRFCNAARATENRGYHFSTIPVNG
jgi:hypothetical protein